MNNWLHEYWEEHYLDGGASGEGDIRESSLWKMGYLIVYGINSDVSIIDVGCGDMKFWDVYPIPFKKFIGIDISPTIIIRNRRVYSQYEFHNVNSTNHLDISADFVTCFDVLFHIMDEDDYIRTLLNLVSYANKKIFIYTWAKNPFDSFINKLIIRKPFKKNVVTDDKFQYYRDFKLYSSKYIESNGFKLEDILTHRKWPYGALYVYEKVKT
jgi:hypothetical protein